MVDHFVEFSYKLPEWGSLTMDIDEDLDYAEKEAIAIAEVKDVYDDIEDVEITKIVIQ